MNVARVIYHLARADFLERVRRYSFLIMLGLAAFLGYQVAAGNMTVRLDEYRGEFNSAWVGSIMSLIATFFFGWFGFYLVKGSIGRDRETGVGQIMAATPLSRPVYTFGKWASNFAVLMAMTLVLAIAAIGIQLLAGENLQLDLPAMFAPFLFIAMPMMALVAALAVLFESLGFLRGGLGNVVYFFLFVFTIPLTDGISKINPALEPLGLGLFRQSMGAAAVAAFPEYGGGFVLGDPDPAALGIDRDPAAYIFHWSGVEWSAGILLSRFAIFGLAAGIALLASIFFDRFDPSQQRPGKQRPRKSPAPQDAPDMSVHAAAALPARLTTLDASASKFAFSSLLISELKLLLKGQRWWWYTVAGGLILAGAFNTPAASRAFILPFAWLWPVLIWSGMGSRELRHHVEQIVFSSAAPLRRQLPASWLAGFIVAALTGSGVLLRLAISGDSAGMLAWMAGAVFIPSFALALGVWSDSSKLFEVLYVTMWYFGPLNKIAALDFTGASTDTSWRLYLALALVLAVFAFAGRLRQLRR